MDCLTFGERLSDDLLVQYHLYKEKMMQLIQAGWFRQTFLPEVIKCSLDGINLENNKATEKWFEKNSPQLADFVKDEWDLVKADTIFWADKIKNIRSLYETKKHKVLWPYNRELDKVLANIKGQKPMNPTVMRLFLEQDKQATAHPKFFKTVDGNYVCPFCGLQLRRGWKTCPYCKRNPVTLFKDKDKNEKVQEFMKDLMKYLTVKMITGQDEEEYIAPLKTEEEFRNHVKRGFSKPIPLGVNSKGESLFLIYDLSAVAIHPKDGQWRVASLWFTVVDKDGRLKFTVWKQPEIHLWKEEKDFPPKVKAWMIKKYDITKWNKKVSKIILDRVKEIEDSAKA